MAKYFQVFFPVRFHGFNFQPGFIWGRESSGAEFAASGWSSGGEFYIYRRGASGEWAGNWETPEPECNVFVRGPEFRPATEAAQIVRFLCGDQEN